MDGKPKSHCGSGNLYDRILRLYKIDALLSGNGPTKKSCYTVYDIWELLGEDTITLKTVRNDLDLLKQISGNPLFEDDFRIEQVQNGKMAGYYIQPEHSLFRRNFSSDELNLICELVSSLGKLKGEQPEISNRLRRFWSQNTVKGLPDIVDVNIQSHKDTSLFLRLFKAVSDCSVIRLRYLPFSQMRNYDGASETKEETVRPYQIKRFGNRWVLIAAVDSDGFICNFSFEQIIDFKEVKDSMEIRSYSPYERKRVNHLFDHAIGPTMPRELCLLRRDVDTFNRITEEPTCEDIFVYAFKERAQLFASYPIIDNGTLREVNQESEEFKALLGEFPNLPSDGRIFSFKCYPYRELKEALMARMDSIIVLKPDSLREDLKLRIVKLYNLYFPEEEK